MKLAGPLYRQTAKTSALKIEIPGKPVTQPESHLYWDVSLIFDGTRHCQNTRNGESNTWDG